MHEQLVNHFHFLTSDIIYDERVIHISELARAQITWTWGTTTTMEIQEKKLSSKK